MGSSYLLMLLVSNGALVPPQAKMINVDTPADIHGLSPHGFGVIDLVKQTLTHAD